MISATRLETVAIGAVITAVLGSDSGCAPSHEPRHSPPFYERMPPQPAEVVEETAFEPDWECPSEEACEVMHIAAGGSDGFLSTTGFTCALLRSGSAVCWGYLMNQPCSEPSDGEEADCSFASRAVRLPTAVPHLRATASLRAHGSDACGLQGGELKCWSSFAEMNELALPWKPAGPLADFQLGLGWGCSLDQQAEWDCFATNVNYRSDVDALIEPSELHGATALALATDHGCALVDGGRVRCWGRNDSGQLGSGDFTPAPSGITLEGVQDMRQIAAGWSASCAVGREGDVLCWGYIDSERFSFGEYAEGAEWCKSGLCRVVPERVEGLPIVRQVVMGKEHACALGDDGNVYCWGSNRAGQLGDGTFQRSHTPRQVLALSDVTMLAAGRLHTCALRENGSLLCWGDDEHGQLGAGPERAPYLCISQWGVHYRCSNEPLPVLGLSR